MMLGPTRPNVLWITCDEMRWDVLPECGNAFTSMPAASRLAREGALFTHAFCQMPKCIPSRPSQLMGRYPHCHGLRALAGRADGKDNRGHFVIEPGLPNLIELLKSHGYRT